MANYDKKYTGSGENKRRWLRQGRDNTTNEVQVSPETERTNTPDPFMFDDGRNQGEERGWTPGRVFCSTIGSNNTARQRGRMARLELMR